MPQAIPAVIAAIAYVGSATTAVVAGTATLAQIATVAAVGIGAGVGSMALSAALTPQIASQGAAVQWEANPDAPLRFAFGRVGVKGSIKDAAVYGPDRMYVSFACTVSAAGPIRSFLAFRAGDYFMSFNGAGMATTEPYAGEMWLSTRLGAQPDTALALPSGLKSGASFPGWTSARKLSGSAAYMVTLGENSKRTAYDGKIPAFVVTIEGLFCYDPRLDSTYPGGSGSCRLNDPATWVWTQNPILFGLKWALGLWEGPTGKGAPQVDYQVGGIGAKVEGIHLASFVAAANISDSNGWTGAAYPSTDDDKAQVLDGFLKAGGAQYAEIAGKIACIHRAAPRATVFTINVRDTAGPVEIDTASSKLNRINTIRPRYWAEDQEWEMTALPEVTSTVWQEEDGQGVPVKRTRGADYTFVTQPKQARELASLEISNSREGIRGRVPLRPYMDPEPGNCFIFDEPDFALSNIKCFVLNVEDDTENDTVIVTFETETDGKYPFAYGQTASPPPAQVLTPFDPRYVSPPSPSDWTITARAAGVDGTQTPGFDLTGTVGNDTATGLIVEWAQDEAGPWTAEGGIWPATTTSVPITGVQSGEDYYIGLSYVRGQNTSARTVFGPYTASQLVALSPEESEALAILDRISSDDWLTKNEKPEVIRSYQALTADYEGLLAQALAQGVSSTAFSTAITGQLNPYLDSLDPAWTDVEADTEIDGVEFRAKFADGYTARAALRTAISAAIALVAEQAAEDADAALDALADIADDNILTRGEKPAVIRLWQAIDGEKPGLEDQGEAGGEGAEDGLAAYLSAYSALGTYLASLSPGWSDTDLDTPIVAATFNAAFETYYVAKQALLNALIGVVGLDAQTALARLAIIDSDGWLSRGEKPEVERQYLAVYAEYPALSAQALAIGATTQRTALIAAYDALTAYLAGLSPAWNDASVDTAVTAGVLATRFSDYAGARSAVQSAMMAIVGADAADALDQIDDITSDNILSPGADKRVVIGQVGAINTEASSIAAQAASVGVSSTAYTAAITALNTYLDGLSPVWSDVTLSTPVSGTTLRSLFLSCAGTRQAVLNAISAAIGADATAALAKIEVIASDNQLSRGEKSEVIRQHTIINTEYPGLAAQALARGVSSATYAAAIVALNSYLDGLTPTWYDLSVDTPITGSTLRTLFVNVAVARQALMTAIDAALGTDIGIERGRLDRIASDNWLTADEKPQIVRDWTFLTSDYALLIAQAASFGVSSSAYNTAITALNTYLASLSPAWTDYGADTVIVGSTFATKFTDADTARTALKVALTAAVGVDGAAANARLLAIANDNILAREEKSDAVAKYLEYNAEYAGLSASALAAGVTTARSAYIAAFDALTAYLAGLSPDWTDRTQDTPIVGTTYVSKFSDYVAAKTALQSAMSSVSAALSATIDSLSATGNSAAGGGYAFTDTLTVTAPSGSTVRWVKSAEGGMNDIVAVPTGLAVYFGGTVPAGGLVRAIYQAVITNGGQATSFVVDVQLSDPT